MVTLCDPWRADLFPYRQQLRKMTVGDKDFKFL